MTASLDDMNSGETSHLGDGQARNVALIVGRNVKRLRKAQGYSLERLAELSGVSRAMLGQIETYKSVPTISLLWKIADALGVSVGSLVVAEERETSIILRRAHTAVHASQEGRFTRRAFIERRHSNDAEFFELTLQENTTEALEQRTHGGIMALYVVRGSVRVVIGDDAAADLEFGDTMIFDGASSYSIANLGPCEATAVLARFPGLAPS